MEVKVVTRSVRTLAALYRLIERIELGKTPKPDWIQLQGKAKLVGLAPEELTLVIKRLHGVVLRGFRTPSVSARNKKRFLDYWTTIAKNGFHDFADDGWRKCYDSPFVENYDYVSGYLTRGLDGVDPYKAYAAVLGTFAYSAEDFINTKLCKDVSAIIEPLAGTADFSYVGHFRYPAFDYFQFDIDPKAKKFVDTKPWLAGTRREYFIGNALHEATWRRAKKFVRGKSLCYLGKQSQNFFGIHDLLKILEWGTTYSDYLMFELTAPYLVEKEGTDELTRPESRAAGLRIALEDAKDSVNPITNAMDFSLVAWDAKDKREYFFRYRWTGWQSHALVGLADFLKLKVYYYHLGKTEFLPVTQYDDKSDFLSENSFLIFTRHGR